MQTFLQTDTWGAYQEALGRKVFFIRGENWKALLVRHDLPLGKNYLYCPKGPMATTTNDQRPTTNDPQLTTNDIEEFLERAMGIAKQERSMFLRWDPPPGSSYQLSAISYKFVETRSVQPQHTLVVYLTKSEEELLRGMHEKTRYNIRLARRHGVEVRAAEPKDINAFLMLLVQTARRDNISLHPREHYRKLLEVTDDPRPTTHDQTKLPSAVVSRQSSVPFTRLYVAEHQGKPLAAAIIIFYNDTVTYLHGASSSSNRNLMAPYLLHWHIMQEAKHMGYAAYDFWGINDNNPRWAGITRFKRGFGGEELHFPGSIDVVLNAPWYGLYRLLTRFR